MTVLNILDGTGQAQKLSATVDGSGNIVGSTCVTDPASGAKQTIAAPQLSDGNNLSASNLAEVANVELNWNGTSFDRRRGNVDMTTSPITITALPAQTITSADLTNHNNRGVILGINIQTISASTNITVTINGKDAVSGQYYTLLATAAITSTGFTTLTVYPGVATTTNVSLNFPLPRTWQISVTIAGSGTVTGTLGASTIA